MYVSKAHRLDQGKRKTGVSKVTDAMQCNHTVVTIAAL